MKQFTYLLFLLVCVNITSAFAQPKTNTGERSATYLKKFRMDLASSMLKKKNATVESYYGEDTRLMPEFQKTIIGKNNVLAYYKAFTARYDVVEYNRTEVEILDLGSHVAELGTFSMKSKLTSAGKVHDLNGKYLDIWQKLDNGLMSLISQAWNYNHSLELEGQLQFGEVPYTDVALAAHLPINNAVTFELAALNRLMEATVSQHDAKIWSQFYADDATFMYSRHPAYHGRKILDEFLESHCKELPVFEKLDIRNDKIIDLGNHVIEYASHVAIWRGGEYSGVGLGKDLRIWRREKNGSLKILWHIAMYE